MHSADHGDTTFLYNPDLSGDVVIDGLDEATGERVRVRVLGFALKEFILDRIRDEYIGRLEQAEGDELLRLLGVR